jgi:DNA-binding Lrp family transcriptional regulator
MDNNLLVIKLDNAKMPEFKEVKNKDYILYGDNNLYPDYLLELFTRCSKHNAIVTGKAQMIKGRGWDVNDQLLTFINKPNAYENLNDILYKSAIDLELFGGFALQITWSIASKKIAIISHLDFSKLRVTKDGDYLYCEDWTDYKKVRNETKRYPAYNTKNPTGTQILYYMQYRPSLKYYPIPDYVGSVSAIETDIEINNFHLNNIRQGFSGGTLINFNSGANPPVELQREISKRIKEKYQGTDRAGAVIVTFSDGKDKEPSVMSLSPSELDKQFTLLKESTTQEIFVGAKVTSPTLFGIATAGALGQRNEMKDAFEMFQNNYIAHRQFIFEQVFNDLAAVNGYPKELKIIPTQQINSQLSENTLLQIMTKDELRQMIGLEPLVQVTAEKQFSVDIDLKKKIDIFSKYGCSEDEWEMLSSVDFKFESMFDLSEVDRQILSIIDTDENISADRIASALKLKVSDVADRINKLIENKLIYVRQVNDNGMKVTKSTLTKEAKGIIKDQAPLSQIKVFYKYDVASGMGAAIIPTTRDFCRALVELKRLYTREDINQISNDLGYSVWNMRGGYYHNPKTDITTPYCRHIWKQEIRKLKAK